MKLQSCKMMIGILVLFCFGLDATGYDDGITHPDLTLRAIGNSHIDVYLKDNLGIKDGIQSKMPATSKNDILSILRLGSKLEDDPVCRASNHFHNPLQSWGQAGLTSMLRPLCPTWDETPAGTRYSALTWATGYEKTSGPIITRSKQEMDWNKARDYFYLALTSNDDTKKDSHFAKTFQAVGQVMHLLQDMAVPAHVRNDFWNSHVWTGGKNPYELYVLNHPDLITNLTDTQINNVKPIMTNRHQTALWDTSDGCSDVPAQIGDASLRPQAGLAEYTNANFVSEGTLFSSPTASCPAISSGFQYPAKTATQLVHTISDPFRPGVTVKRPYYYRPQNSLDWESDYRLAAVNYTFFYDPESGSISPDKIIAPLDDYVHRDYAQKLLPRAVGYSAALLDYFFRGTLEISSPDINVYGLADGSKGPYQQFTKIRAKVKNITANGEAIGAGMLQAIAKYRIIPNYAPDLSTYPPSSLIMSGDGTSQHPPVQYSYSVSATLPITSLSSSAPAEFTFDFGQSPIPAGITDLTLQIIFKGTLGNEANDAIAVGMKDLSEPTHLVFWNLTDEYIYGTSCGNATCYQVYFVDDIINNSSFAAIRTALSNAGITPASSTLTFSIAFRNSITSSYVNPLVQASVPPGGHIRLIALMDDPGNSVSYLQYDYQGEIYWTSIPRAVTRVLPDGSVQATPAEIFLSHGGVPFRQHFDDIVTDCYPPLLDDGCPYPLETAPEPKVTVPVSFTSLFD